MRHDARYLAPKGAKIVVTTMAARRPARARTAPAQSVMDEVVAAGGEAVACTESVATFEGGKAIVQAAIDAWGRVDILIHNAGNVRSGAPGDISYEDLRAVVDVHPLGASHVVRPAFPLVCAANHGRIILTGSIGGLQGTHNVVN